MNLKLLIGIVLFVIGLATAVVGIVGVADSDAQNEPPRIVEGNRSLHLAVGGLLIGISVGNWKNPRTHLEPGDQVVDPEGYHKMKHV
jgi:hypothetical protein